jgi:aminoglycoside phosphotransferase (APT) family kinase protein
MIVDAADQARWLCTEPRRTLSAAFVDQIVSCAFPGSRALELQPLTDGLRNANFRLRLNSTDESFVLRIYEHDPSLCQKELDLLRLIGTSVPVPEVLYAEPHSSEDAPPFALLRYVEGISYRELNRGGDRDAIAQAASAVGEALAAIGRIRFSKAGWLASGPSVYEARREAADRIPRFVEACFASKLLQERVPVGLCDAIRELMRLWAPRLEGLEEEARLVHGDFGKRNVLVKEVAGVWRVAAVLDWEFAFSGAQLVDLGHFLRYERRSRVGAEPHFSDGFLRAGGVLPEDWRRLARIFDAAVLCESLTHERLSEAANAELIELIRSVVEDRDPLP